MKPLFAVGRFADDSQRILAAVQRLAIVGIERSRDLGIRAVKLRTATFTNGKSGILLHDSELALGHEYSLAPNACVNETAPVPEVKAQTAPPPALDNIHKMGTDRCLTPQRESDISLATS